MNYLNTYASLDPKLYHKQSPDPLTEPKAGHFNPIVAKQIGWADDNELVQRWVEIVSGNHVPDAFEPLAMTYAGHQFGHWAGQLGDGRGLLMAQVRDVDGTLTDLHLKGAGMTPYSRMGDGRAVLRSTIREYLCGHAMRHLGIASSSALGFVTSSTQVHREGLEQGACLLRVADSHVRLGHFEWVATFAPDLLPSFTEYVITTYYPQLATSPTPLYDFAQAVIEQTAKTIANWQLFGFIHGVMNTDNLSITGSTLDYGPFAFMERFDPTWISNHSDHTGRYVYQNQPAIGRWNLQVWLKHLSRLTDEPLFDKPFSLPEAILADKPNASLLDSMEVYNEAFTNHYHHGICKKLGVPWLSSEGVQGINNHTLGIAFEFLDILQHNRLDYTNSFRALIAVVAKHFSWQENSSLQQPKMTAELVHAKHLLTQLKADLKNKNERDKFARWAEDYVELIYHYTQKKHNIRLSNDTDLPTLNKTVWHTVIPCLMDTNPVYILRSHMAQKAIEYGEAGSFAEVERLFDLLTHPFAVSELAIPNDVTPPVKGASPPALSCSS